MFSNKDAVVLTVTNESMLCAYLSPHLKSVADAIGAEIFLLCAIRDDNISIPVTTGIDRNTINGASQDIVRDTIIDCYNKYPAPHVHNIAGMPIAQCLSKISAIRATPIKAIYYPVVAREMKLVCLGFSCDPNIKLSEEAKQILSSFCDHASLLLATDDLARRLRITEFFAKEVGHDIASAVQATVSKLRNVTREIVTGKMALQKTREAEDEIMAAYRVAETLGITVDPNYNIGEGRDFSMVEAIQHVIRLYRSEAQERHIEFKLILPPDPMDVWGDRRALESAIGQLVLNAIKYAKGSSYITLHAAYESEDIKVTVTDAGIPLDPREAVTLWQFGQRGKRALELHVNGSGIGLYTVKKIIEAHGGRVFFSTRQNDCIVTFGFAIPKRDILRTKLKL